MNKNLKRALNTTAAVSMSLAMVLGAVSPVSAKRVEDVTDKVAAKDAYKLVEALYNEIGDDVYEAYKNDTFAGAEVEKLTAFATVTLENLVKDANVKLATTTDAWYGEGDIKDARNTTLAELVGFVADNNSYVDDANEDVVKFAKFLNGLTDGIDALEAEDITDVTANGPFYEYETNGVTSENYDDAAELYKVITDNEDYLNAVVEESKRDTVFEKINNFKAEVEDYKGENEDTFVKEYVRLLEDVEIGDTTVYDLVEKEAKISYKDLSKVEKAIKAIKNDDASVEVDGEKVKLSSVAKYDDVKDAEEVAAYIEGLEAIVEDMKEVKDILKSTNEDVKAYKKNVQKLVDELVGAVNKPVDDDNSYTDSSTTEYKDQDAKDEAIENAMLKFRSEDRTALKEFVESYVEQFYALTPKQLSSGKYVVRLENAEYGRYVDTDDVFTGVTATLETLLTKVIDNGESADTYYDELVEAVTTVDELLKAVTTDIEGLTFDTKITSVEANKIVKAKKALKQLLNAQGTDIANEYKPALTRAEEKEILANAELIEALYFKLIINGEVTTIGWVQTPQGWEYYDNNGKRVMDGWAAGAGYWSFMKKGYSVANEWCAAKDGWYYMDADGKMVYNTTLTIDGVSYTFDANGLLVD